VNLSSKNPVAYVDVRTFAHATEDNDKVLKALQNVLPPELVETIVFKKTGLCGHHGNPIVLFEARVKDRKAAGAIFSKVCAGLGILDKELLNREIDSHLEKGNIFLRLDKQAAFQGEMKLGREDSIHLRVHFKRHMPAEVMAIIRAYGLIP
jgi:RNA binding exosome subunit